VCERCGLFLCEDCVACAEPLLCGPCLARRGERLVTVAALRNAAEAGMAQSLLAGSGVASRLGDDALIGFAPHLSHALGGIKLLVAESDAALARQLLDAAADDGAPSAGGELPEAAGGTEEALPAKRRATVTFRVAHTRRLSLGFAGLIAGISAGAGSAMWLRMPAATWIGLSTGILVGGWVGSRIRADYCAAPGCMGRLAEGIVRCPGCGARIAGEVRDPSERLAADERLAAGDSSEG
jgi:Putative prokaryotic signal transducing protein